MRVKMIHKIGFFIVLALLFSFKTVNPIGVGQPMPVDFKLLRNDEGRFLFYVFGVGSTSRLSCSYSVAGLDPLVVTFDEEKVFVEPGGEKISRGSISVPGDAPIKSYSGNLQVTCEPMIEMEGATGSVIKQSMTVPFLVSIVEKLEEREAPRIPEEEKPTPVISTSAIFTIIIIVILVIGVGYWFSKKVKKKE